MKRSCASRFGSLTHNQALTSFHFPWSRFRYVLIPAIVSALTLHQAVFAGTKNWNTNVSSGNWSIPGNWVENAVPTPSDSVFIAFSDNSSHVVTLDTVFPGSLVLLLNNQGSGSSNVTLNVGPGTGLTIGVAIVGSLGHGQVNQSGGSFTANISETVGSAGNGSYILSGGTNSIGSGTASAQLIIGQSAGSSGMYVASNGAGLVVNGAVFVGGSSSGPGGTGVLNLAGGTMVMNNVPNALITVYATPGSGLTISGGGKLDLNTAVLVEETSSAADKAAKIVQLTNSLLTGSNGGNWTGTGITSSAAAMDTKHYAVGLFDNALVGKSSIHNQPLDSSAILVNVAHLGDANDNGIVDIQDQSIVTNHWQSLQNNWGAGDLNLDGFVDLQDLTLVTNNWQQTSIYSQKAAIPNAVADVNAVPEPTSLVVLGAGVFGLFIRRRSVRADCCVRP